MNELYSDDTYVIEGLVLSYLSSTFDYISMNKCIVLDEGNESLLGVNMCDD